MLLRDFLNYIYFNQKFTIEIFNTKCNKKVYSGRNLSNENKNIPPELLNRNVLLFGATEDGVIKICIDNEIY